MKDPLYTIHIHKQVYFYLMKNNWLSLFSEEEALTFRLDIGRRVAEKLNKK